MARDSRPLGAALHRVERLSDADQFVVLERLLERLGGELRRDSPVLRTALRRGAAMEAIRAAYSALELTEEDRLEVRVFDSVPAEQRLGWSSARVIRAWGSWQTAVGVFRGEIPPGKAGYYAIQRLTGIGQSRRRDFWDSLREWLSDPETGSDTSREAYERWRRARNEGMALGELRHRGVIWVSKTAHMSFEDAVQRSQAGEFDSDPDVLLEDHVIEVGGRRLVSSSGIGVILNYNQGRVGQLARGDEGFPEPSARVATTYLWDASDIAAYEAGVREPGVRWRLQHLLYDGKRLARRLNISYGTFTARINQKHRSVTPPDGYIQQTPWWDAERVERWFVEHAEHDPIVRARADADELKENTITISGHDFVSRKGAMLLSGLSAIQLDDARARPGRLRFPPHALMLGQAHMWAREDVEQYAAGHAVEREAGYAQYLVYTKQNLADRLRVSRGTIGRRVKQGTDLPGPPNLTGTGHWWSAEVVEQWIAEREQKTRNARNIGDNATLHLESPVRRAF